MKLNKINFQNTYIFKKELMKGTKKNMKNNKGVTLISLMLTVIVILILTSAMIYNTKNQLEMRKVQNLNLDIENLNAKVDDYYLKYGELPILCNYIGKADFENSLNQKAQSHNNSQLNRTLNVNDGDSYAVIDLEKLGSLTLNYGYDDQYSELKTNKQVTASNVEDEIYVINTKTHQIYFPHGIFVEGMMYYMF